MVVDRGGDWADWCLRAQASEYCPVSLASIFGVRSARVVSAVAGRGGDELWEYCWACAQAASSAAQAQRPPRLGAAQRRARGPLGPAALPSGAWLPVAQSLRRMHTMLDSEEGQDAKQSGGRLGWRLESIIRAARQLCSTRGDADSFAGASIRLAVACSLLCVTSTTCSEHIGDGMNLIRLGAIEDICNMCSMFVPDVGVQRGCLMALADILAAAGFVPPSATGIIVGVIFRSLAVHQDELLHILGWRALHCLAEHSSMMLWRSVE